MTYITPHFFQQIARLARRADDGRGAAMAEDALLIALIGAVCITVLGTLGTNLSWRPSGVALLARIEQQESYLGKAAAK